MSDYIEQIFNRTNLQVIRETLNHGVGDENDLDKRPYKQRLDEDSAPMRHYLENTYPDGEKRDAVYADISKAIVAHEEVYFEIGMKCGAHLLHQLMLERQPLDI